MFFESAATSASLVCPDAMTAGPPVAAHALVAMQPVVGQLSTELTHAFVAQPLPLLFVPARVVKNIVVPCTAMA